LGESIRELSGFSTGFTNIIFIRGKNRYVVVDFTTGTIVTDANRVGGFVECLKSSLWSAMTTTICVEEAGTITEYNFPSMIPLSGLRNSIPIPKKMNMGTSSTLKFFTYSVISCNQDSSVATLVVWF
jgi:hypothetical protein